MIYETTRFQFLSCTASIDCILFGMKKYGMYVSHETKFCSENTKEREHLEDLGINGEISEWILGK
jgi:hypothetical protein